MIKRRLQGEAAKAWRELSPRFDLTNPIDAEALRTYCEQYDLYLRATADVNKDGLTVELSGGRKMAHPSLFTQSKAIDQMRRVAKVLSSKLNKGERPDVFDLD